MRRLLSAAALTLVAVPAFAANISLPPGYTPYHELNQIAIAGGVESIDYGVAALPSSDINGSFNRISALLERGSIRDLGFGQHSQLPANFERGMEAAIQDLRADVAAGFGDLTVEQQFTLLQVIDVIVVRRNLELYGVTLDPTPCVPIPTDGGGMTGCFFVNSPYSVVQELDLLASSMNATFDAIAADAGVSIGSVRADTFDGALDIIRTQTTWLAIKGVESIDD